MSMTLKHQKRDRQAQVDTSQRAAKNGMKAAADDQKGHSLSVVLDACGECNAVLDAHPKAGNASLAWLGDKSCTDTDNALETVGGQTRSILGVAVLPLRGRPADADSRKLNFLFDLTIQMPELRTATARQKVPSHCSPLEGLSELKGRP